ncbi:MAG: tetratricopeptide repeat protein [Myxococcota bacterium]
MSWALCLALLIHAGPTSDELKRAQTHFRAGKTHYDLRNYSEAIREFAAGYALAPRPEFLINLGQAYRGIGDLPMSLKMFQQYLEKAPADAPNRGEVRELIRELEKAIAEAPPKPADDAPRVTKLEPSAAAPGALVEATPPAKPINHLVWIIPVGVAVVAAAGVGIAVAVANGSACAGAGTLGCVDLRTR